MTRSAKRAKANATSAKANATSLKNIPSQLLNMVLSHASPQSIRRVSQVNKSLKSIAEPRVGGEIVLYKPGPVRGCAFYKLGNNGELKPLQKCGEPFEYYKKFDGSPQGRFVEPRYSHTVVKNLRLVREPAKNRPGYGYQAFRVKPKSPTPERKTIATKSKSTTPEQRATKAKLMEHEQRASNASKAIMSKIITNNKKFCSNPNHPIAKLPAYRNMVLKILNEHTCVPLARLGTHV